MCVACKVPFPCRHGVSLVLCTWVHLCTTTVVLASPSRPQSSKSRLTSVSRIRTDPRKWGLRTINSTHRYFSSSLTSSNAAHSVTHLPSRGLLQTPQPCPTLQAQKMQSLIRLIWKSWSFWGCAYDPSSSQIPQNGGPALQGLGLPL